MCQAELQSFYTSYILLFIKFTANEAIGLSQSSSPILSLLESFIISFSVEFAFVALLTFEMFSSAHIYRFITSLKYLLRRASAIPSHFISVHRWHFAFYSRRSSLCTSNLMIHFIAYALGRPIDREPGFDAHDVELLIWLAALLSASPDILAMPLIWLRLRPARAWRAEWFDYSWPATPQSAICDGERKAVQSWLAASGISRLRRLPIDQQDHFQIANTIIANFRLSPPAERCNSCSILCLIYFTGTNR